MLETSNLNALNDEELDQVSGGAAGSLLYTGNKPGMDSLVYNDDTKPVLSNLLENGSGKKTGNGKKNKKATLTSI